MHLDIAYFAENWKLIIENNVVKYFLLLQITIHTFLSLGWSMNNAMDQQKKNATYANVNTTTVPMFMDQQKKTQPMQM